MSCQRVLTVNTTPIPPPHYLIFLVDFFLHQPVSEPTNQPVFILTPRRHCQHCNYSFAIAFAAAACTTTTAAATPFNTFTPSAPPPTTRSTYCASFQHHHHYQRQPQHRRRCQRCCRNNQKHATSHSQTNDPRHQGQGTRQIGKKQNCVIAALQIDPTHCKGTNQESRKKSFETYCHTCRCWPSSSSSQEKRT